MVSLPNVKTEQTTWQCCQLRQLHFHYQTQGKPGNQTSLEQLLFEIQQPNYLLSPRRNPPGKHP
jgi:hypothetical protein